MTDTVKAGRDLTARRTVAGIDVSVIADDMDRVETLLARAASSDAHPLVSEAALHLIKAGGKRMRPALVLLSSCAGKAGLPQTDLSAAAIELVHIATLYHDDVIDETQTRRGVPTAHARWGVEVAVLAGDYLFARGCALGAEAGGDVPAILAKAIGLVCEGQIMETASLNDPTRSVDHYLGVVERKTAALFDAATELGASTAGAEPEERRSLVEYGKNLGVAFQIVDDVLDVVGDPRVTGKEPGSDLREGVFTLPVILAAQADTSLAERFHAGERDLQKLLPAITGAGGVEAAMEVARAHAQRASDSLDRFEEVQWVVALRALVRGVLDQAPMPPN